MSRTGLPIERQTVQEIVDQILEHPERTKLMILAPVVQGRKGEYKESSTNTARKALFAFVSTASCGYWRRRSFLRSKPSIPWSWWWTGWLSRWDSPALGDSVEQAATYDGVVRAAVVDGEEKLYSERFESTESGLSSVN